MEVDRICEKCGKVNMLSATTLKHADVYTEEKQYLRLTYYVCVECKERIVVQVDDMKTREIFGKLKRLTIKCAAKNVKHETISPKDIRKKDRYVKQLRSMRAVLERENAGKKLYEDGGKVLIEGLTIGNGYDTI